MASNRLGKNAKMYRIPLTGETEGTPVEITNIKDLTLDLGSEEADATTRGSGAFRETAVTFLTASLTFGMQVPAEGTTDANFDAIENAYLNKTTVRAQALDGALDVEGNKGLKSDWVVSGFSRPQTLDGIQTCEVTMKPGDNTSWVTIEKES